MKQLIGKLNKNRAGFSLVELLVVVLILLLVTSVIIGGLPAAQKAYYNIVDKANSQVLLSTAATRLRDELGMAENIAVSSGRVRYIGCSGAEVELYQEDNRIWLRSMDIVQPLLSDAAISDGLFITYDGVAMSGDVVIFSNLIVWKEDRNLAKMQELCIRVTAGG